MNALGLMAGKAEKVSLAVCRMLVTSGLDFDAVLDDFKREGPDKAELRLRTAFLNKMSCQSKAVIDQGGARSLTKIFLLKNHLRMRIHFDSVICPELIASLKLGNVWVFVQLIFGTHWPLNQLNKIPNIALLEISYQLWTCFN